MTSVSLKVTFTYKALYLINFKNILLENFCFSITFYLCLLQVLFFCKQLPMKAYSTFHFVFGLEYL